MKRLTVLYGFLLLFVVSACDSKSVEYTLTCADGRETFEYVYDDEELLSYYYNGRLVEDGSTVDGMVIDYESLVKIAGGIDNYIRNTKDTLREWGFNCTVRE